MAFMLLGNQLEEEDMSDLCTVTIAFPISSRFSFFGKSSDHLVCGCWMVEQIITLSLGREGGTISPIV